MLVLTRKLHERILIGDDVEVVVVAIRGQRAQLGILAPAEKRIRRRESLEPSVVRAGGGSPLN